MEAEASRSGRDAPQWRPTEAAPDERRDNDHDRCRHRRRQCPGPASWAANAHIPALRAVPEFELRAVATSRRASADAAAELYGVPGHDDYRSLIERPDVDLVVVAVKVARHHEIVSAALAAGKMVYCEWPLAGDFGQARDLAARAAAAGVRTVVGLQGRYAPEVQTARELVASGALGSIQSTTLTGSGIAWGPRTDRDHAYLYDAGQRRDDSHRGRHAALDALTYVLGPLRDVTATTAVAEHDVRLVEDGSPVKVSAPDQVAVTGTLRDGAVLSAFYRLRATPSVTPGWTGRGWRPRKRGA